MKLFLGAPLLCMVSACAVTHTPTQLSPLAPAAAVQPYRLDNALTVEFDTGYRRTLKAGSKWRLLGQVAQGDVFKPHDDVFTLEGAHIHEAYLVVRQGILVGFYLPAERGFSSLKQQTAISLQPGTPQ